MIVELDIFGIVSLLTSAAAIMVSVALLSNLSKNRYNGLLVAFILLYSTDFFSMFFESILFAKEHAWWYGFSLYWSYAPFLLLYVCKITEGNLKRIHWLFLLIPGLIELVWMLIVTRVVTETEEVFELIYSVQNLVILGGMIFSLFIFLLIHRRLKVYQKEALDFFSFSDSILLTWIQRLNTILIVFHIVFVLEELMELTGIVEFFSFDIISGVMSVANLGLIYWIGIKGMKQPEIFGEYTIPKKNTTDREANEECQQFEGLVNQIRTLDLHRNPKLTLTALSRETGIPEKQISTLIKENTEGNFYHFINDFRLEDFKQFVRDGRNQDYTIIGLAFDAGFNSKSTFNAFFKRKEGRTPKQFADSLSV